MFPLMHSSENLENQTNRMFQKLIDVRHSRFGPSFGRNEWKSNYVLGGIHLTKVMKKSIKNIFSKSIIL